MKQHITGLMLAVLTLLMLGGCSNDNQKITIKLAHGLDAKHPVHQAIVHLDERLKLISDGKMGLDIYPSGQLGSERELIELLQIGSLGMTKISASTLEGFVPEIKVFNLPYLFKNNQHLWKVLNNEIGRKLLVAGEPFLIRGLGYYDAGSRSFYSTDRPVNNPAFGELYTALQQGVVDGAENNPPSFYLSRHYEVSKFYTLDEHTSIPDVILISKYVWDTLTEQQQRWLQQATDDSVVFQRGLWQSATDEALAAVKAAGVEVIIPDKSDFLNSVDDVYAEETDPNLLEMITAIKSMAN